MLTTWWFKYRVEPRECISELHVYSLEHSLQIQGREKKMEVITIINHDFRITAKLMNEVNGNHCIALKRKTTTVYNEIVKL